MSKETSKIYKNSAFCQWFVTICFEAFGIRPKTSKELQTDVTGFLSEQPEWYLSYVPWCRMDWLNHWPICLLLENPKFLIKIPFRFEKFWLSHPDFQENIHTTSGMKHLYTMAHSYHFQKPKYACKRRIQSPPTWPSKALLWEKTCWNDEMPPLGVSIFQESLDIHSRPLLYSSSRKVSLVCHIVWRLQLSGLLILHWDLTVLESFFLIHPFED